MWAMAVWKAKLSYCMQKAELYIYSPVQKAKLQQVSTSEGQSKNTNAHLSYCMQKAELRGLIYERGLSRQKVKNYTVAKYVCCLHLQGHQAQGSTGNKYESLMSTNGEITSHVWACMRGCHISNMISDLMFYTEPQFHKKSKHIAYK
jgi:hypothetical protein